MRIELVLVTPEWARQALERNYKNRRLKEGWVKQIASDMKNGNYTEDPDLICFDTEGHLSNGQHRLNAIILADVTIPMHVAYDVPVDAVIDKGKARDTGDALYMRGLIEKDASRRDVLALAHRYLEICGKGRITDTEMAKFLNSNHDSLLTSISISAAGAHRAILKSASTQAAIFAALKSGVDYDKLYSFASVVNTGFMANQAQSAAIVLRNYILENRLGIGGSAPLNDRCAVAQMAIRDFVNGVPRKLRYGKPVHVYIPDAKRVPTQTKREG